MCNLDVILNPTIYTYSPKYKQLKFVSNYRYIFAMCISDYNLSSFVVKRSKTSIWKWLKAVHWIRQRILNVVSKFFNKLTNKSVLKKQQRINKQDLFFWFVKQLRNQIWNSLLDPVSSLGVPSSKFWNLLDKSHQIQFNKLFDHWSFEISLFVIWCKFWPFFE